MSSRTTPTSTSAVKVTLPTISPSARPSTQARRARTYTASEMRERGGSMRVAADSVQAWKYALGGGAVGAATGAGYGKVRKTSLGAPSGIGALMGAVLGYGVRKWQARGSKTGAVGTDSLAVTVTSTKEGQPFPILTQSEAAALVPGQRLLKPTYVSEFAVQDVSKIKSMKAVEPPGWLGTVVEHGSLVQAAQQEFIRSKAKVNEAVLMPGYRLKKTYKDPYVQVTAGGRGGRLTTTDGVNTTAHNLWMIRYAEWPSPAWEDFRMWSRVRKNGTQYPQEEVGDLVNSWKDTIVPDTAKSQLLYGRFPIEARTRAAGFALDEYYKAKLRYFGGVENVATANVSITAADDATPLKGDKLQVPSYFTASSERESDFWARLREYYAIGQWLVWAGEMMRLHCTKTETILPNWWKDHCLLWGVGPATPKRVRAKKEQAAVRGTSYLCSQWRGSKWTVPIADIPGSPRKPMLRVHMSKAQVWKYLEAIVRHTPAPGSYGFNGAQIAKVGVARQLLDIPDRAGSIKPPYEIYTGYWLEAMIQLRSQKIQKTRAIFLTVYVAVLGKIIDVATAGATSGATTAATMVTATVLQLARTLTLSGGAIGWDDVLTQVANFLDAVASEMKLGKTFEEVTSTLNDLKTEASQYYQSVMLAYEDLKDVYGWDFFNEAYGSLQQGKDVAAAYSAYQKAVGGTF